MFDALTRRQLRQRLSAGANLYGLLLFTASPVVVEFAAAAGLDFVILDMEHSALDLERAAHCLRAADACGITAFIRVPRIDPALINTLLNLGAAGIVLAHARLETCSELVRAMRYAPVGNRGACQITRAAGYRRGNWDRYAARENSETLAIALIEDEPTLHAIGDLARLPGVDVLFVGPSDLSIALGVPDTTFDDEVMGAALDRVVEAARRNGKHVMTLTGNQPEAGYVQRVAQRGVSMIVLGTDADLLIASIAELLPRAR